MAQGRTDPVTEIITFGIPERMTRAEVLANCRRSAPTWRANPDLIRKTYILDPQARRAGGIYLWRRKGVARRARDAAWLERVRRTYGSEPVLQYFETPILPRCGLLVARYRRWAGRRLRPRQVAALCAGSAPTGASSSTPEGQCRFAR